MLYVVKMGWKEMADTSRIDEVLSHALKEVSHITIDSLTAFMDLCSRTKEHMGDRKILFVLHLAKGGVNFGYCVAEQKSIWGTGKSSLYSIWQKEVSTLGMPGSFPIYPNT